MKGTFIKLLAWFGFKEAIQDYVYKHQSKSYKDNLEFAFIDSGGRKYYYFPDMKKLPLAILEKLNELQEQMQSKVPGKDLDLWMNKVEEVLNGNSKTKVTDVGYWLGVLKDRRSILFDPTILTEIAALLYIREDEMPTTYNREIHKEKFEMLWADSQKGGTLYDFFQQAGLSRYIPSDVITRENYQEYLMGINAKIEQFDSAVTRISTLGSGLSE